jgi:hypothetical protein
MSESRKVTLEQWKEDLLDATDGTRTGAIARCALGRNTEHLYPRFTGKASITSDRYVMCSFVDRNGCFRHDAFVGGVEELTANIVGVADYLRLSPPQRAEWFTICRAWIAMDYSGRGLGLPDGDA